LKGGVKMNYGKQPDLNNMIQSFIDKSILNKINSIKESNEYPEYMDIGTASKYLGVSRGTFKQKILKESNIPTMIISERITRFKKSDLDNYMSGKSL
jgi:hypothetical protein